jgi:formate hydrogenlyase subunit 3/multisubunit Na+/H+ antiporter MnhD subunit
MWLEYIVLFSIAMLFFSITVVLTVETVHTTNSISKKRKK